MTNANVIENYAMQVKPLSKEDGGGFEALFPQLARGVVGYGATAQAAVNDLMEAVPVFLAAIEDMGQTLPAPEGSKEWDEFSGKFNVRVAKVLHAQLHRLAEEQGVSLNSLVQTLLMSGATALSAGHEFGAIIEAQPASVNFNHAPSYHWKEEQVFSIFAQEQDYTRVPMRERNPDVWREEMVRG